MLLEDFFPNDVFWFTLDTNERAAKLWEKVAKEHQYEKVEKKPFPKQNANILVHYYEAKQKSVDKMSTENQRKEI